MFVGAMNVKIRRLQVFPPLFTLYVIVAVGMLAMGLLPALIGASEPARDAFLAWGAGQGLASELALGIVEPAHGHLDIGTGAVARDYLFSLLNLTIGVLLVWRRPRDWLARLLGVGMIGAAVAQNFYAHEVIFGLSAALPSLGAVHIIFHGAVGTTLLHAILMFPNGVLVPRWTRWLLPPMYGAMLAYVGYVFFLYARPLTEADIEELIRFAEPGIALDALLVVLFFGVAIPAAGVLSEIYRARTSRPHQERQQARLVVWALSVSFGAGFVFLMVAGGIIQGVYGGFTKEAITHIEGVMFQLFPPLFSIIPIALFIAIVRYRLFDVDVLINKTAVYAPLTAVLGGLIPPAVIGFRWLLSAVTGKEQSDAALILTVLFIAAVVSYLRVKLQALADRHFRLQPDPTRRLREFCTQVRAVSEVMDPNQMAGRLLDEATVAFGADGGAVALQVDGELLPVQARGDWDGNAALTLPLESQGLRLGVLSLGPRSDGRDYGPQDVGALKQAADDVAHAMAMMGEEQWRKVRGSGRLA